MTQKSDNFHFEHINFEEGRTPPIKDSLIPQKKEPINSKERIKMNRKQQSFQLNEVLKLMQRDHCQAIMVLNLLKTKQKSHRLQIEANHRIYCLNCGHSITGQQTFKNLLNIGTGKDLSSYGYLPDCLNPERASYVCPHCQQEIPESQIRYFKLSTNEPQYELTVSGLSFLSDLNEQGKELLSRLIYKGNQQSALNSQFMEHPILGYQLLRYGVTFVIDTQTLQFIDVKTPLNRAYFYFGPGQELSFELTPKGTLKTSTKAQVFSDCFNQNNPFKATCDNYLHLEIANGFTWLNATGLGHYAKYLLEKQAPEPLSQDALDCLRHYEAIRERDDLISLLATTGRLNYVHQLVQLHMNSKQSDPSADVLKQLRKADTVRYA